MLCSVCVKFAPLSHDLLAAVVRTIQGPKLCSEVAGAQRVVLSLVLVFPCTVGRCIVGGPVQPTYATILAGFASFLYADSCRRIVVLPCKNPFRDHFRGPKNSDFVHG